MSRCLFIGSNGAGLGHVTRLLAIARRLPDVEIIFGTMSKAIPLLAQAGYVTEYIPTVRALDIEGRTWNAYLEQRVQGLLRQYEPDLLAFDGTMPYAGLVRALRSAPDVRKVWVRRAMWRPSYGRTALERRSEFDLVIEPGEVATDLDIGATFLQRDGATRVGPILSHDSDELLERDVARHELGLPLEATIGLVLLGAGNINDLGSPTQVIVEAFRETGVRTVVAESPISERSIHLPADVEEVRLYPIAPYYRAFDLAVSASGYNSFHELIAHGVPTLFVPNLETKLDDQWARAEFASETGAGLAVVNVDPEEVGPEIRRLADPAVRAELRAVCASVWPGNGAEDAATAIRQLLTAGGA